MGVSVVNLVVEFYIEGLPVDTIAQKLGITHDDVINTLREYKRKDTNGKDYVMEFKEMVVERILTGEKKVSISRDLGVAYKTINKYLDQFNVDPPRSNKEQEESMFEEIDWHSFSECPTCNSDNVNDLNIYKEEGIDLKNSYCLSCGTEWLEKGRKTYKVIWEYVE